MTLIYAAVLSSLLVSQSASVAPAKLSLEEWASEIEPRIPQLIASSWELVKTTGAASVKRAPKYRLIDGSPAPPRLDGETVVLTKSYLLGLYILAAGLAHDAHLLELGSFPSKNGDNDYLKQSPVLPQWGASPLAIQRIMLFWDSFVCSDLRPSCETIRSSGITLAWTFVISHELAHLANGDPSGARQLALEMKADEIARDATRKAAFLGEEKGSSARATRMIAVAIPILVLQFQRSLSASRTADSELRERNDNIEKSLSAEDRASIAPFLLKSTGTLQTVRIDSDRQIKWLSVDGVRLAPDDVIGHELVLRRSEHVVAAVAEDAIAYQKLTDGMASVSLVFQALLPARDSTNTVELVKQRKWLEVLVRTSDDELQPRSAELALSHWKALYHLDLTAIDVSLPLIEEPVASDLSEVQTYEKRLGSIDNVLKRQKYHQLADAGDVLAKLLLAFTYWKGSDDVAVNMTAALRYFRESAEKGSNLARVNLAYIYENGDGGVPIDRDESRKWYRLAAEDGNPTAQFNVGVMYDHGMGVPPDPLRALYWYKLAASQGNKAAPCNIGILYELGSLRKDDAEATRWYTIGANRNDSYAQYNLGRNYRDGAGIARDLKQAYFWLRVAAENGHSKAIAPTAAVKASLTTEEISSAENSVKAWLTAHPNR